MNYLEFIETMVFSRDRKKLMDDDEFRSLQTYMLENYENGDTIAHTGGCKKIHWYRAGAGKVVELGLFIIQERSQEDYICFLSILKIVKTT